jgi:hypothetical protein
MIGLWATSLNFFHWNGVLWTFCQGWPGTVILPISAFHIAGITSVSHQPLASFFLYIYLCNHYLLYLNLCHVVIVFGTYFLLFITFAHFY